MKKICPTCKEEKLLNDFNSQGKYCRECHNRRNREWRKSHPEQNSISQQKYIEKFIVSDNAKIYCSGCKKHKAARLFYWKDKKKKIRSNYCKKCQAKYSHKHYIDHRDEYVKKAADSKYSVRGEVVSKIIQYFNFHPCVDCGEKRILRLEFDHVRGKKLFNISDGVRTGMAWKKISKEIEKCDVRCANCHREKTARERKYVIVRILDTIDLSKL